MNCKMCLTMPVGYDGATFCGAACCAQWESGLRSREHVEHAVREERVAVARELANTVEALLDYVESQEWAGPGSTCLACKCTRAFWHDNACSWVRLMMAAGRRE
jgi:hypothetical protein